jgi:hypothetical protein
MMTSGITGSAAGAAGASGKEMAMVMKTRREIKRANA